MKNLLPPAPGGSQPLLPAVSQAPEREKNFRYLSDDVINNEPVADIIASQLGFETYDLGNVHFITYTGLAHMIDLMKSSLQKGIEIQFVNTSEKIKSKIKAMGIDHLLNCA